MIEVYHIINYEKKEKSFDSILCSTVPVKEVRRTQRNQIEVNKMSHIYVDRRMRTTE